MEKNMKSKLKLSFDQDGCFDYKNGEPIKYKISDYLIEIEA